MPDKNFVALIEAFAEAGFGPGEAELELCGTGPLDVELSALAEQLGVPLRLHGYIAPDELPALYREADVLALVSTYEPFGVTVREAAAAGPAADLLGARRSGRRRGRRRRERAAGGPDRPRRDRLGAGAAGARRRRCGRGWRRAAWR